MILIPGGAQNSFLILFQILNVAITLKSPRDFFIRIVSHGVSVKKFSALTAFNLFKSRRITLLNAHLFHALVIGSFFIGFKKVYTEHSTLSTIRHFRGFAFLASLFYASYNSVVCVSDGVKKALLDFTYLKKSRFCLINNCCSQRFKTSRSSVDYLIKQRLASLNAPLIISVGRLEPSKDHATLLRLMLLLPTAKLYLVGEGSLRVQLENSINELGLSDRVFLCGQLPPTKVCELLDKSTIYIQPSRWEGFGLAALEAMCRGLPCILSDVPGLRGLLPFSTNLFRPSDEHDLLSRLLPLISSPEHYISLSSLSFTRSLSYDQNEVVDSYFKLYESLFAQH